jgi:hypothetical protein
MSSLSAKDRVSLCQFTFADGRRCRTPRTGKNPHFWRVAQTLRLGKIRVPHTRVSRVGLLNFLSSATNFST